MPPLRYTSTPFPAYRFIPGVNPHPGIDPLGHSYQKPPAPQHYSPPEQWRENLHYLEGVDLFNHGYWWEAHEAWEHHWLMTKKFDLEGQYYQALIQFSAAMLKLYAGSRAGFEKLFSEADKRMGFCRQELGKRASADFQGLTIAEWLQRLYAFQLATPLELDAGQDPLQRPDFPYLVLADFSV